MTRKEAIKEYKARKIPRGVFALRCTTTGHIWIDTALNLEAARNGLWYILRHGLHRNKALQAEWNANGEQSFEYEILEKLEDDLAIIAVGDALKEKKRHWVGQLSGEIL